MSLSDIIDKLHKIKEKSIKKLFDDKNKKLKLSEFIEEVTPESWKKYIKNLLNYSFPKTKENLYRSYLVNTGIFLYLLGLYGLLNDNNYRADDLLYEVLGYSYSIIFSTLYYRVYKFREIINRIIPYV